MAADNSLIVLCYMSYSCYTQAIAYGTVQMQVYTCVSKISIAHEGRAVHIHNKFLSNMCTCEWLTFCYSQVIAYSRWY